jgi:solute carrier family 13 (sodium-dependent dicarboxylate transporter), member 2/3/5
VKRIAVLVAGPLALLLAVVLPAPAGMAESAWRVAGLAVWMALWWLTAIIPLEATSLVPLAALPLVGGGSLDNVAVTYADPVIFLFLGGFLIAATLERWALHRRFAAVTLGAVGSNPRQVVLAFLLITAFLSMWISNTATAVMMLPIASATVAHGAVEDRSGYAIATMLAVAFGASIGGVATLIGTPPNAIFVANARELAHAEFTFASWLPIGLSLALPLLAACWVILIVVFRVPRAFDGTAPAPIETATRSLEAGDRFVIAVFALAALSWVLRTPKQLGALRVPGLTDLIPGLTDPAIGLIAALVLFAVPLPRSRFRTALDWETARRIPWGILLLFGGGITLAAAFDRSGLSGWIGGRLHTLAGLPVPVVIAATATLFVLLTELTSNTATAALAMPLMAGVAQGIGLPAVPLMLAAALACSMAFMLPVATPPNAIVFGHGGMRIGDMVRAGVVLDAVAVGVITVIVSLWTMWTIPGA